MRKLWKTSKRPVAWSLLAAVAILAADIGSRAYFAVGGGGMAMAGVITYWIYRLIELKGGSHEAD